MDRAEIGTKFYLALKLSSSLEIVAWHMCFSSTGHFSCGAAIAHSDIDLPAQWFQICLFHYQQQHRHSPWPLVFTIKWIEIHILWAS